MFEDANELPYPRIEKLAGFKGVFLGEKLERFRLVDAVGDLAVLIHACRSIAVELAESAAEVIFVQEYVDAGERQRVGVTARQKHQFAQALIEGEHVAVFRCFAVMLDDFAQDSMRCLGDGAQRVPALIVVESGDE